MTGLEIAAIGSIVGPALGGIVGNIMGSGDRAKADQIMRKDMEELAKLGVPPIEAQKILLQKYKNEGTLTPELEEAVSQGPSAYEGITTNSEYGEAGLEALESLRQMGASGGMTMADRSNLEKVMGDISADERGKREAITNDLAARGQLGSGLELAAKLGNQQASAQRAHEVGAQVAGDASERALEAIARGGSLASDLRGQEFGEKSKIAEAQDAIARWNAANLQDTRARNVASMNTTGRYNLDRAQEISNANVDKTNEQEVHNKGLVQKDWENRFNLAGLKSTAAQNQAAALRGNAAATGAQWAGIGSAIGKGAGEISKLSSQPNTTNQPSSPSKYSIDLDEWEKGARGQR